MSRRYETTGNSRPHGVATGYQYASRYDVPLQRTNDTTPTLTRIGLVLVVIAFAGMWFVPPDPTPAAASEPSSAVIPTVSAADASAGGNGGGRP